MQDIPTLDGGGGRDGVVEDRLWGGPEEAGYNGSLGDGREEVDGRSHGCGGRQVDENLAVVVVLLASASAIVVVWE